jgi:hypothetical protein
LKPILKANIDELSGHKHARESEKREMLKWQKSMGLMYCILNTYFLFKLALSNGYNPEDVSLLEEIRAQSWHLLFRERTRVDHNIRSDTFTDWSLAGGWLEENNSGHVL